MAGYDVNQVIEVVEIFSHFKGFQDSYGILLNRIKDMKENEPNKFYRFKTIVEEQHFTDPVDVVLFFET